MIESDLTLIEILGLGVAQEVAAYKRYQLMAQRVSNPLVKEKFHSLAREEQSHRELLYDMLKKYSGEDKPPLPKKAPREYSAEEMKELPLHEIIELAIRKEIEAQEFYKEAALKASDPKGRQLLQYLATYEEGHERALKQELDALTKYPQWFEIDGPDIQLVGP